MEDRQRRSLTEALEPVPKRCKQEEYGDGIFEQIPVEILAIILHFATQDIPSFNERATFEPWDQDKTETLEEEIL